MYKNIKPEICATSGKTGEFTKNILGWFVYFIFTMIVLLPILYGNWSVHICASMLISFLYGMLNKIIQLLTKILDENHSK